MYNIILSTLEITANSRAEHTVDKKKNIKKFQYLQIIELDIIIHDRTQLLDDGAKNAIAEGYNISITPIKFPLKNIQPGKRSISDKYERTAMKSDW